MSDFVSSLAALLLKVGVVAFLANEIRGVILAGPLLYAMYRAGGTGMATWLGLCSLAGIVLSVVAPLFLARKLKLLPVRA
ncbi:MAG TPA: hypothetical protein VE820_04055 [Sphingomicrobium sp.]|nr:hypothetical protein [Sphingomicrobium sp.]